MSELLLNVQKLDVRYGGIIALKGIDISVKKGELVAVIGSNGAGKTTMLKAISGQQHSFAGEISFRGKPLLGLAPHKVTALGIAHSPEGRKVFPGLSVQDNLRLGGYVLHWREGRRAVAAEMDKYFGLFPILRERRLQPAGTLSGGQQQMLAIARALMSKPKLLLLDEPSMGLAPIIIDDVFRIVKSLRDSGEVTVLLVEQLAYRALQVADRAYVLEQGTVRMTGTGTELLGREEIQRAYLGERQGRIL